MNDKVPTETPLIVMANDNPEQRTIGFTVREYMGSEVYLVVNDQMVEKPLTQLSDIEVGACIAVSGLCGYFKTTVQSVTQNRAYADNGTTGASLVFDDDDRHCWTSHGIFNLRAVTTGRLSSK